MSQSIRQSDLFAGESWLKIYEAFTQVNFTSYDFETIRESLINYIRQNYSENFNDWIQSSELVAIIDLIAYVGQALAFRVDLNARENFIDLAERKESVLRIAQMLFYKPRRNLPATGLLRIEAVSTNDDIFDSFGKNLNGVNIIWNDPNNSDWLEHFVLIMNNAFIKSNPFGQPLDRKIVPGNIEHSLYELDTVTSGFGIKNFSATVDGYSLQFDVVNVRLNEFGFPVEESPRAFPRNRVIYRNDRNGFSSPRNGFFFLFKEGVLNYQDFKINNLQENLVLDIDKQNINETDVWVQTIDDTGAIVKEWKKIPSLFGTSVIYNSLSAAERDIFEVITRNNDAISIRFGDNRFSNIPFGLLRVFYRVSSGLIYTISPDEIQTVSLTYNYVNKLNQVKTLNVKLSLLERVANSLPSESVEEIRRNAPRVYYTQNRMVNGEDYNVYPLIAGGALKINAVNRVYSGQSRYFDLIDPTSKYNDVDVYGDDGILFKTNFDIYREFTVNPNFTPDDIVFLQIQPFLLREEISSFMIEKLKNNQYFPNYPGIDNPFLAKYNPFPTSPIIRWRSSQVLQHYSTGYFYVDTSSFGDDSNPNDKNVPLAIDKDPAQNIAEYLSPGTMIKFENDVWVTIKEVKNNGLGFLQNGSGTVTLSEPVPTGKKIVGLIPPFRKKLNQQEIEEIKQVLQGNPQRFALYWNWYRKRWQTYTLSNETPNFDEQNFILLSHPDDLLVQQNRLNGWVILINVNQQEKPSTLESRGSFFVFESERKVRFYFSNFAVNENKELFNRTGDVGFDTIDILSINPDSSYTTIPSFFDSWEKSKIVGQPIQIRDTKLSVYSPFFYRDGYVEPRRVKIKYFDSDFDGYPDNPEIFEHVVKSDSYVFWERYMDQFGYIYYKPKLDIRVRDNLTLLNPPGLDPLLENEIVFIKSSKKFYRVLTNNATLSSHLEEITDKEKYVARIGRAKLHFHWKHYSKFEERIDPAVTNIIDVFVLDETYDKELRIWNERGSPLDLLPSPPTSFELEQKFKTIIPQKMISDQMIFHPVKYKLLYGSRAREELQAKFEVVKIKGRNTLPDNELKARLISSINEYFSVRNWDFGQTVYFSELAAFIHLKLATQISSIRLKNPKTGEDTLQEIKIEQDEIPISVATVDDIIVL